ncbi:MAG: hypothetical protein J6U01_03925 [Clostridia bacterium]|nr:hypothetical protein [Clostridia bacterium]
MQFSSQPNPGRPTPAQMKSAGRFISMLMGLILSFFQSLAGQLFSGHFTLPGWLISLALSICVSWLIGWIVPMGKVSQSLCQKLKCEPGSLKARLAETCVSDLIFTPFITLANVLLAWRNATAGGAKIPFLPMFLSSLGISLLIGFVLVFIFQPLCKKAVLGKMMKK